MSVTWPKAETDPVAEADIAAETAARQAADSTETTARSAGDAVVEADLATHAALKRGVHGIPTSVGSGLGLVGDGSGGWSAVTVEQTANKDQAGGYAGLDANGRLAKSGPIAYGTLASRPAAASVPDGFPYFATDDVGGTLYQAQAAAWLLVGPRAAELAYAEVTSNQATSSNSFIDVTGWTITVTSRGRPYIVRAWLPVHATNASAGGGAKYRLVRGDTSATVGECDDVQATAGNPLTLAPLAKRIDVAAGTQIAFKVQIASRVAGTVTFTGSADMPLAIQATEL